MIIRLEKPVAMVNRVYGTGEYLDSEKLFIMLIQSGRATLVGCSPAPDTAKCPVDAPKVTHDKEKPVDAPKVTHGEEKPADAAAEPAAPKSRAKKAKG